MRIGINGYEAIIPRFGYNKETGLPNRVGSGLYCYELLVSLFDIDKNNEYIIYLPEKPTLDLPKESSNWHYQVINSKRLWTAIGLSKEFVLKRPSLDIFFSPTHYLPLFMPYRSVISILDLSYLHFPQYFKKHDLLQLKYWSAYSVRKASKILTISKSSKDDIIKMYQIPENRVIVTYPGIKIKTTMQSSKLIEEKYEINNNYILFVGTLQPRKNITRLIEAFSTLCHPDPERSERGRISLQSSWDSSALPQNDISLVIIGKKGWLYKEILQAPEKLGVKGRVKFLESVPDEDLSLFYQNALCFVLPSLYEGFGLPVLEAMQNGCPVITSNVSSLPEAGGDAALYVNPEDVDDIASKMKTLIENRKIREELVKKGYNQVKKFSWEKTAKETLSALEQVVKNDK